MSCNIRINCKAFQNIDPEQAGYDAYPGGSSPYENTSAADYCWWQGWLRAAFEAKNKKSTGSVPSDGGDVVVTCDVHNYD